MKKLFLLGFILFSSTSLLFSQVGQDNSNTNAGEGPNFGTALGSGNDVPGQYAFIGGSNSFATGSHSFGFGQNVQAIGAGSFALGQRVVSSGENSWIIGSGFGGFGGLSDVSNSISNSLYIGFNSRGIPSLFIKPFGSDGVSEGYVGIHTDNPTSELDVNGTITTLGFKLSTSTAAGYVLTSDADGNASWQPNDGTGGGSHSEGYWNAGGNNIYFRDVSDPGNNTGRVGIGIVNPEERLHVVGNILNDGNLESTGNITAEGTIKSDSYYQFDQAAGEIRYGKASLSSSFKIRRYKDGNFGKSDDPDYWKDVLVIDDLERIGIGTDTPSELLDVNGNVNIEEGLAVNASASINEGLSVGQDAGISGDIVLDGSLNIQSTDSRINFGEPGVSSSFHITNVVGTIKSGDKGDYDVEVVTVSSDNNVGIKNINPSEALDVGGKTKTEELQITNGNLAQNNILADVNGDGNATWVAPGDISGVGVWNEENNVAYYSGGVGIGTDNVGTHKLVVDGSINATLIKVTGTVPQSDYVFEKNYQLMSLSDLDQFVKTHKHLPEVMSAEEFAKDGYSLGEMDDVLLRKVEELTLYVIDQDKTIKKQQELLDKQQQLIDQLLKSQEQ